MVTSAHSPWQKWSSSDFLPEKRFDAWQDALNQSHLRWTLCGGQKAGFAGNIEVGKLHDLQIMRCLCQPCSGLRGKAEIAATSVAFYGLLFLFEGYEEVRIDAQSVLLKPGDILLWDSTRPMHFKLHSPINKITLLVPQSRMHVILPHTRQLVGNIFDWRQGLGAVATSHIKTLLPQVANIGEQQRHQAVEITLELLTACLGWQPGDKGESPRTGLLTDIKRYIEHHLDDPELGPQNLAEHFSISVRYLHLLFTHDESTVSRWILSRRLERCRCELEAAEMRKNITEVAFDWGFNDAAHFSRVFKKQYGLTPREYRRRNAN